MSTTRLFDQDAYLGEFEATVERSVCEGCLLYTSDAADD